MVEGRGVWGSAGEATPSAAALQEATARARESAGSLRRAEGKALRLSARRAAAMVAAYLRTYTPIFEALAQRPGVSAPTEEVVRAAALMQREVEEGAHALAEMVLPELPAEDVAATAMAQWARRAMASTLAEVVATQWRVAGRCQLGPLLPVLAAHYVQADEGLLGTVHGLQQPERIAVALTVMAAMAPVCVAIRECAFGQDSEMLLDRVPETILLVVHLQAGRLHRALGWGGGAPPATVVASVARRGGELLAEHWRVAGRAWLRRAPNEQTAEAGLAVWNEVMRVWQRDLQRIVEVVAPKSEQDFWEQGIDVEAPPPVDCDLMRQAVHNPFGVSSKEEEKAA